MLLKDLKIGDRFYAVNDKKKTKFIVLEEPEVNGKTEKRIVNGKKPCLKCKRPLSVKGVGGNGLCTSCRRWRDRVYTNHDWVDNKCTYCGLIKRRTSLCMLYFRDKKWVKGKTICSLNSKKFFPN